MILSYYRKLIQKFYWFICDTITDHQRANEALNTTFLMSGIMVKRWNKEDTIKSNQRRYWLEYGKYP